MTPLDISRLERVVGLIPRGRWTSYGDVARACGGRAGHARTLNQKFIRHNIAGAHRVLMANGRISPNALGDPVAVRRRLEAEGVRLDDGRATHDARVRAEIATSEKDTEVTWAVR